MRVKFAFLALVAGLGLAIAGCGPTKKTYLTNQASTAAPEPTGSSTGTSGGATLNFQGDFDPSKTYHKGDVVLYNGQLYIALIDNPGPILGPGWTLLSGAQGPQGPAGPPGADGTSTVTTVVIVVPVDGDDDNTPGDNDGDGDKDHKHHRHGPPTQPGKSPNGPPGTVGNPNH